MYKQQNKNKKKKPPHTLDPEDKSLTSLIDNSGLLSDATIDPVISSSEITLQYQNDKRVMSYWASLHFWSENPKQDRALLSSSLTQHQLLRASSMWPSTCWTVCPTTRSDRIFTTYLPQHNFDPMSVFPFTRRWLTVLLPLQAHNRPKPTSHLHFLATKLPFDLGCSSLLPVSHVLLLSLTSLCWNAKSSALKGV